MTEENHEQAASAAASGATEQPKGLAVAPPPPATPRVERGPLPLNPTTMDEVFRAASWLSKSSLLPPTLQNNAPAVAHIMLMGKDLGLSASQALRGIYVVENKPSMSADMMAGLAQRDGVVESIDYLRWDEEVCHIRIVRPGKPPIEAKFTHEDAKRINVKGGMKLADKDNYKNWRPDMLKARALARGLRAAAPGILFGFYVREEVDDAIEVEAVPVSREKGKAPARAKTIDDLVAEESVPVTAEAAAEVLVDRSTSQGDQPADVAVEPAAAETSEAPKTEAAPEPTRDQLREKAFRADFARLYIELANAIGPAAVSKAFEAVKVSESIESFDMLTMNQLEALRLELEKAKSGAAPPKSQQTLAKETPSEREIRLMTLARSTKSAAYSTAIGRVGKSAGSPAASYSSKERKAVLDEVFGKEWPA